MSDLLNFLKDPEVRRLMVQDLLDSANRGIVANTLGAPVDAALNVANLGIAGAGYVGHKTGLLREPLPLIDPQEAFGSSEWIGQQMQQRGMVSGNRNPLAEAGFSMLSPVAARGGAAVGRGVAKADLAASENAAKAGRLGNISRQRGGVNVGSAYKDREYFHGTSGSHTELSDSYQGNVSSGAGVGHWFSYSPNYASEYAQNAAALRGGEPRIARAKLTVKNPLVIRFNQSGKPTVDGEVMEFDDNLDAIKYAKKNGFDAIDWPDGSFTDEPSVVVFKGSAAELID